MSLDFWKERSVGTELLLPFSLLYLAYIRIRKLFAKPKKASVPVICVGNATVGGAGKTPVAIAIAEILQKEGIKIAFASRGYRGKFKDQVKVDLSIHTAEDVGDEPLLLARTAPTWVAKNRFAGVEAAAGSGAEIVIMDDGLQNDTVLKDLSIMVVDGGYGFGNSLILPAGPLREPARSAIRKSQIITFIGEDRTNIFPYLQKEISAFNKKLQEKGNSAEKIEVTNGYIEPVGIEKLRDKSYVAFAGIGRPEKFFDTLKENFISVVKNISFEDHYRYKKEDLDKLYKDAKENEAELITTEKDAVRLPPEDRQKIKTLSIKIKWGA